MASAMSLALWPPAVICRLLTSAEDSVVKLLLQAFQLSLGAATEHPTKHLLREQMLCRLMVVSQAGPLLPWYEQQHASCAADALMAPSPAVLHLLTRTPTLNQAGGVARMTLRGHTLPVRKVLITPNGKDIVTISDDGTAQVRQACGLPVPCMHACMLPDDFAASFLPLKMHAAPAPHAWPLGCGVRGLALTGSPRAGGSAPLFVRRSARLLKQTQQGVHATKPAGLKPPGSGRSWQRLAGVFSAMARWHVCRHMG